jgi:hypothetical protein
MAVYGGFKPWKGVKSSNLYQIAASYGTSLFQGDVISRANTGYAEVWSAGVDIIGVALAFFSVTRNPIPYWVASTATVGYVLVADHPDQEFVAAEDADTSQLAQADVFLNVSPIVGTGDSTTGQSAFTIDSSSKNTTSSLGFRLVALAPIVGNAVYNATTNPNPKWIVTPNDHQLKDTTGI